MTEKIADRLDAGRWRAARVLLYAAVLLLPLIIWRGTYYGGAAKEFFVHTTALLFFVLLFFPGKNGLISPWGRDFIRACPLPLKLAGAYGLAAAFSLLFSPHARFGLNNNLPLLYSVLFFFFAASLAMDKDAVRVLSGLWLAAACLFSLYSLPHYLGFVSLPKLIGNSSFEAGYLVLSFPIALSRLLCEYDRWREFNRRPDGGCFSMRPMALYAGLTMLFLAVIAATLCRGATLGIAASVFTLALCCRKADKNSALSKHFRLISVCLAALVITGFAVLLPQLLTRDIELMGTAGVRAGIWRNALRMGAERPLTGWGYGTFKVSHGRYGAPRISEDDIPRHAHNEVLQVFSETGVLGLSVFILLFSSFFSRGARIIKGLGSRALRYSAAGFMSATAGILAANLLGVDLRYPVSPVLMAIAMGAVISLRADRPFPPVSGSAGYRGERAPEKALAGALSIILIISAAWLWKEFALDKFLSQYRLAMGMRYLATVRMGDDRFDGAVEQFDRAFQLNNTAYRAQWYKAEVYRRLGRYEDAVDALKEVESIFPDTGRLQHNLGLLYLGLGSEDEAELRFKRAVRLSPGVAAGYVALGKIYFGREMYEAALELYNKAFALGVVDGAMLNNIGNIYFMKGEFEEALRFYSLARSLSPEDEGILYNIENTLEKLNPPEARD